MLSTSLQHLATEVDVKSLVTGNTHAMICCGRMGPMCVPVYGIMERLRSRYPHVAFADMDFDIPAASVIMRLPECAGFRGLPFTVYYRNGKVVRATASIQTQAQVTAILDSEFRNA
jgi:thioredoxin 1